MHKNIKIGLVLISLILVVFYFFQSVKTPKAANGPVNYGDTLNFVSTAPIESLFPLDATDLYAHRVSSQIFETLFIQDLKKDTVLPHLAKTYRYSKDRKKIIIGLRDNVFFHNDVCFKGESNKLTAHDVKFALDFACSNHHLNNSGSALFEKIKGGKAFNLKNTGIPNEKGVKGIKVIDDYTIEITLNQAFVNFQKLLTSSNYGIFSKIAFNYYQNKIAKHPIGSGAFQLNWFDKEKILLIRNNEYWKFDKFGNKLPYLDALHIRIINNKENEFIAFRNNKLDLLFEVPAENLSGILGNLQEAQQGNTLPHRVLVAPGTRISFLAFNCDKKPFDNPKVRQAFELVLDRERLCSEILNGDGTPADKGFVPPSQYYDNNKLKLKKLDINLAKILLKDAGFNTNNPFPKSVLYIVGPKNSLSSKWCQAYCKDLKTSLGISLNIVNCDFKTRDAAIKNKKADLWKVGWVADYPDPESYFNLFFNSERNNNQVAIPPLQNIAYNAAFSKAAIETNNKKRNELFLYCDRILQENYIILPVVIDDFVAVINLKVRNLELNPLGLVNFTEVYKKDLK